MPEIRFILTGKYSLFKFVVNIKLLKSATYEIIKKKTKKSYGTFTF